jgi:hypothetical protein
MKSAEMNYIKDRDATSETHGNRQNPFAELRHYIGRLAYHAKCVRVLISAARRIPALFLEPRIETVEQSPSLIPLPPVRGTVNLDAIANRMIKDDPQLLAEIQARLRQLNQSFDIAKVLQEEHANKYIKPCVHAELNLLEHFYANRDHIEPFDNDKFIGCSKPACYCCFLYIRAHPGNFVEPATHQKIYVNWMPPTSIPGVQEPQSELAKHERVMLNNMVVGIRARAIEQIQSQTGRRKKHFDSTTGETFSAPLNAGSQNSRLSDPSHFVNGKFCVASLPRNLLIISDDHEEIEVSRDEIEGGLASRLERMMKFSASDEESEGGGVQLN